MLIGGVCPYEDLFVNPRADGRQERDTPLNGGGK